MSDAHQDRIEAVAKIIEDEAGVSRKSSLRIVRVLEAAGVLAGHADRDEITYADYIAADRHARMRSAELQELRLERTELLARAERAEAEVAEMRDTVERLADRMREAEWKQDVPPVSAADLRAALDGQVEDARNQQVENGDR